MEGNKTLKNEFIKYIKAKDVDKNNIYFAILKKYKNIENLIQRIKVIIDYCKTEEQKMTFINNIVKNDEIDIPYLEQLESMSKQATMVINVEPILKSNNKEQSVVVTKYDNFLVDSQNEMATITEDGMISINGIQQVLTVLGPNDNYLENYFVEKMLNSTDELCIINSLDDSKSSEYVASDYKMNREKKGLLVKEEALCVFPTIYSRIENVLDEKMDRTKLIRRIMYDLITNQNYRDSNDLGIKNSDKESDFYVLDGETYTKPELIEVLLQKYPESVKDIADLIIDNKDQINDIISRVKELGKYDIDYINAIENNINLVFEKWLSINNLDKIASTSAIEVYDKKRKHNDEAFIRRCENFEQLLGLNKHQRVREEKKNYGYIGNLLIIFGTIASGILLACVIALLQ